MVRVILLDIRTGDETGLLRWAICCGQSKDVSAIWWFRLWGVGRKGIRPAKEKISALSILP